MFLCFLQCRLLIIQLFVSFMWLINRILIIDLMIWPTDGSPWITGPIAENSKLSLKTGMRREHYNGTTWWSHSAPTYGPLGLCMVWCRHIRTQSVNLLQEHGLSPMRMSYFLSLGGGVTTLEVPVLFFLLALVSSTYSLQKIFLTLVLKGLGKWIGFSDLQSDSQWRVSGFTEKTIPSGRCHYWKQHGFMSFICKH